MFQCSVEIYSGLYGSPCSKTQITTLPVSGIPICPPAKSFQGDAQGKSSVLASSKTSTIRILSLPSLLGSRLSSTTPT